MVLISIQPFASKKVFLLAAVLLCLSSALCFADSLFMSLHSTPYGRHLNRIQTVPERTVQPPLPVACQPFDGRFAQETGWLLSETLVLDPTINRLALRSAEVGERPYNSLCPYEGSRKYDAASFALQEKVTVRNANCE
jgi:hypothetical protein